MTQQSRDLITKKTSVWILFTNAKDRGIWKRGEGERASRSDSVVGGGVDDNLCGAMRN